MRNWFDNIVSSTGYNPFSAEAMVAKAASPATEEGLMDVNTGIKAVVYNDPDARKELSNANSTLAKGSLTGAAITLPFVGGGAAAMSVPEFFTWSQMQKLPAAERIARTGISFLGSAITGQATNDASVALTGKSVGENVYDTVSQVLPNYVRNDADVRAIGTLAGDFLNPGYVLGGYWTSKLLGATSNLFARASTKSAPAPKTTATKTKPEYSNWGGEFVNDTPHTIEANQYDYRLLDKALSSGKLKFGTPTTYTAFHQASSPIREFKFPFNERWDVVHHGADPNSAFLTGRSPAKTGFLSKRPYTSTFEVSLEKPLIQTGEIHGATKNGMRNKIVKYARDNGADGVVFEGILDNQVPEPQQIIQLFDTGNYKFVGGPAKVEYYGPTMGKTTIVKRNPELYVDLDALVKDIRAKVAKDLGLSVTDPKVGSSPQYKNAVKNLILEFRTNNANAGKTLLGSQRLLLDNDVVLDNTPMLPDFKTFVERNAVRGFKESIPEQRLWYKSIADAAPDIQIDNRYISEIKK